MKFCENCGTKAEALNQYFCNSCGTAFEKEIEKNEQSNEVEKEQEQVQQEQVEGNLASSTTPSVVKRKMKKWQIFSIVGLVAILAIAHFTMKSYVDPTKAIKAMDEDFQTENKKGFLSHFEYSSKINSDTNSFYDFIEEQSWRDLRSKLFENVETFKKNGITDPIEDNEGNKLFKLNKEPILGGLYTKVSFEIIPTHVEIYSEFEKVAFTSEKKTTKLDAEEATFVGDFLPGDYKWSAVLKGGLGDLPFDGEMKIGANAEKNKEVINLDLKPPFAEISINNYDAELLVNGKKEDFDFYNETEFGPLPLDGSVTLQAEVEDNGKTYKSNTVKVKSEKVKLTFNYLIEEQEAKEAEEKAREKEEEAKEALEDLADEHSDSIHAFYENYRKSYESDVNEHKYDVLKQYVVDGTKLDSDYRGYFKTFKSDDHISNHTNNLSDLEAIDENTFKFNTWEQYTFYSHKDVEIEYVYTKTYTIIKSGNSYKFSAIDPVKVSQEETPM